MILAAAVCQNLGPKQTRKRRLFGYLMLNVGLVLAVIFIWLNVNDILRMLVFIPFFLGYLGVLQAIQKTCVVLALKGMENQDQGNQALVEASTIRKLKVRSFWILIIATFLGLLCTYLTLAIHAEHLAWPQGPAPRM